MKILHGDKGVARPEWFVNLIKKAFPQRYWLARLTNLPVVGEYVDRGLFEGDDLVYLPIDQSILINEPVTNPGNYLLPSKIVEHFIDSASLHWVMDFCLCRESNNCENYSTQLGCLFLGEAVLQINPKFGQLVTKEEAHAHVQRCREAGLMHMIGRNKLDALWLGAGPGERLLTVCNCCPCCCLWNVLPEITPLISSKINRLPGVNVQVGEDCIGCGDCIDGICFVNAIQLIEGQAVISDQCRGCGRCVDICPNNTIELTFNENEFIENAIQRISRLVNVH